MKKETDIVSTGDPYDLKRFVDAQNLGDSYATALREIRAGRKESHWIWYVFPQLSGLGTSWMCNRFGIASRQEASAYLSHPILGARLVEITKAAAEHLLKGVHPFDLFGGNVDAFKFRSSMTLFESAGGESFPVFGEAISAFAGSKAFENPRCPPTESFLRVAASMQQ